MDDISSKLKESLDSKRFVVTCEIGPPKGTNTKEIEEVANLLKGKVDAVNVTDLQSSVMRLGSLTVSHLFLIWVLNLFSR
jgi:methylenetetrahydrofolate reductase (NADPH)